MSKYQVSIKRMKRGDDDGNKEDWRDSASTFSILMHSMFKNKSDTDVILKIKSDGGSKDVECHSMILAAHSPVLRTMINNRWAKGVTRNEDDQRIFTLGDDDPQHFASFIDMMYWDWNEGKFQAHFVTSGITVEILVGVLSLAHKYLACHIIKLTETLIHHYLKLDVGVNSVKLYRLLKDLPICEVGQAARKQLRTVENCLLRCGPKVFSSDAVLELTHSDLIYILKKEELLCDEDTIFMGCLKWAKEQIKLNALSFTLENMRSALGDIIKSIRFPLLTEETVNNEVLDANILTQGELDELLAYIISSKCIMMTKTHIRFLTEPRFSDENVELKRLEMDTLAKNVMDFSTPHGFLLTVSKRMILAGVRIYGGNPACNHRQFQLKLEVGPKKCQRNFFNAGMPQNKSTLHHFMFPPVVIEANTPILIKFSITGGSTYVSDEKVEDVTTEVVYWMNEIVTCTFRPCSTIPNGLKQIPGLIFAHDCYRYFSVN